MSYFLPKDILADKKNTGVVEGDVLINGKPKDKYFNRYMGYVEQFDSHLSSFTVEEAITFSAQLRLPNDYTEDRKRYIVEKVMKDLNLTRNLSVTLFIIHFLEIPSPSLPCNMWLNLPPLHPTDTTRIHTHTYNCMVFFFIT